MPLFLTLRDGEGNALVTAMLPPGGRNRDGFSPIIVGVANNAFSAELLPPAVGLPVVHHEVGVAQLAGRSEAQGPAGDTPVEHD